MDENSLWKEVIRLKYRVEGGGWFTKMPKGSMEFDYGKPNSKGSLQLKKIAALSWLSEER